MVENQLWVEKYKAKSLAEYAWFSDGVRDLINDWMKKKTLQSVLLSGSPGTGKTTLANLIIKTLRMNEDDVLRLYGSKDNNTETMRTTLQEFCELGGWSGIRIVFFDEADSISHAAQMALRSIIDTYKDVVKFIFTCNFPHRIIDAISSSRFIRIDFEPLPQMVYLEKICTILANEGMEFNDDTTEIVQEISDACYPDLRRAINTLQASYIDGKLTRFSNIKYSTGVWESYFRKILTTKSNPNTEIANIRDTLAKISSDEMINVYKFLVHNSEELFGAEQIKAIYIINNGQKVHNNAILPDFILLEVFLRLLAL